jgi:AcrR family transcriptional regulator
MSLIHSPKQERSKETQEKLLSALDELLKSKFFEQISIRDIAEKAEVSPGTVYRRFKNKEALLPILYERFDSDLCLWADTIWNKKTLDSYNNLRDRIHFVITEHIRFYKYHAHILRTLYLYIRLNGELSLPNLEAKRTSIYEIILNPIWQLQGNKSANQDGHQTARFLVLTMLSTLNERFLFEDYRPSKLLMLSEENFIEELTEIMTTRLS